MYVYGHRRGLGQDFTGELTSLASATDTFTGLPIAVEFGLGLLGAFFLASWGRGASKSYKKSRKKRTQTAARRAQLKAELAAL